MHPSVNAKQERVISKTLVRQERVRKFLIVCWLALMSSACTRHVAPLPSRIPGPPIGTPHHVALLLPLQGKYAAIGEAIMSGFQAASTASPKPIQINAIDTTQTSVSTAYAYALRQGTDFIVGPLLKSEVQKLASLQPSTPILSLNYLDDHSRDRSLSDHVSKEEASFPTFYQFGLSPLDEARQAAALARQQGLSSALVLTPDNNRGHHIARAFEAQWEALGGQIVDKLSYTPFVPELGTQIRQFLRFEPPNLRREDFDVIFLVATPKIGRQIKPLLSFYYANNIPIYATDRKSVV